MFDTDNEKVIGKMKDEAKGKVIDEFAGLKSKMLYIKDVVGKENTTGKEINSAVVENIKHEKNIDVLFNEKIMRHKMKRIQSKLHRIGTYDVSKISLFCFDDKRYILDDDINTLAYFHKDTRNQSN